MPQLHSEQIMSMIWIRVIEVGYIILYKSNNLLLS